MESGRWPRDDEKAVHALKSIFILTMTEHFGKQFHVDAQTSRTRDMTIRYKALPIETSLIVAEGPYLFELMLTNKTEMSLTRYNEEKTAKQLAMYKEAVLEPLYNQLLLGMSTPFPCYPEVARLVKRWAGIGMFSSLIPEIVLDIIACYPFLNTAPYDATSSTFSAFANVINLLATFDFAKRPLLLNFNNDIKDHQVTEMLEDFNFDRPSYPCLAILSKCDADSTISRPVAPFTLKLLRDTARKSREKLADIFRLHHAFTWKTLKDGVFSPPDPTQFNMLIELLPISERTIIHSLNEVYPVSIDSAQLFVNHIEKAYGDLALILYDPTCIHRIGLIWKPGALDPVPLETCNNMNARTVVPERSEDDMVLVKPDMDCIQEDITHCGNGIIQRIWINN